MKFNHSYDFGYPKTCNKCSLNPECYTENFTLKAGHSYRNIRSEMKLMMIGQDPIIRKNREKVTHVLMLNKGGSIYIARK